MVQHKALIHVLGLFLLVNTALSLDARAGTGSVVARDTDKVNVSELKGKLARLSNLLSYLDDGDETDLQNVAQKNQAGATPAKAALTSEDMGTGQQKQVPPMPYLAPEKPAGVNQNKIDQLSQDSSIQILAKALTRLNDPKFNKEDSTGEYLATENNESESDSQKTQDMEDIIARALTRLSQDKNEDTQSKREFNKNPSVSNSLTDLGTLDQYEDGTGSYLSQQPTRQELQEREEAIRVVETRLMQDILLANKLGISIYDLIRDLDSKSQL